MRLLLIMALVCLSQIALAQEVTTKLCKGKWLCVGSACDNEMEISVKGVKVDDIIVTTGNGSVTRRYYMVKKNNDLQTITVFAFQPVRPEDSMAVDIGVRSRKGIKHLKQIKLHVVCPPASEMSLTGSRRRVVVAGEAKISTGLAVIGSRHDPRTREIDVVGARMQVIRYQEIIFDKVLGKAAGHFQDDPETLKMIESLKAGDKLKFTDIKYKGPCECTGDAAPVSVTLN